MSEIRIHGIATDSIVDGKGLRLAVFVQGCGRHCDGCHNPSSQPRDGGEVWEVSDVVAMISPITQGVTLSGGEPFDQPAQCAEIAQAAHERGLDVWAYTGYTFEELFCSDSKRQLLSEVDVLVDGAFVKELHSYTLKWKGSSNQRIISVRESLESGKVVLWESQN